VIIINLQFIIHTLFYYYFRSFGCYQIESSLNYSIVVNIHVSHVTEKKNFFSSIFTAVKFFSEKIPTLIAFCVLHWKILLSIH
jgi:hypothetical protein